LGRRARCRRCFLPPREASRASELFQELKQRRIVQIVASCAVSGRVALEVVGALVERGTLPDVVSGLKDAGRTLEEAQAARPIRAEAEAWGQNRASEDSFVATIWAGIR
jgi:hypothetical protein